MLTKKKKKKNAIKIQKKQASIIDDFSNKNEKHLIHVLLQIGSIQKQLKNEI